MKGFLQEFRDFINRGNVMDMAVGVIIGAAFTAVVTSLTNDIIKPFITLITGSSEAGVPGLTIPVPGTENGIDFSAFISAIINFLIIAFVVFLLIKGINSMQEIGAKVSAKVVHHDGQEMVEKAPVCPYCLEEVNVGATRCHHCAGELPAPAEATMVPVSEA